MMDEFFQTIYVYEYQVSDDGATYSKFTIHNNKVFVGRTRRHFRDDLKRMFRALYDNTLLYRTFVTNDGPLEGRLKDKSVFDIYIVKPEWEQRFNDNEEELVRFVHNHIGVVYDDEDPIVIGNLTNLR